MDLREIGWEDVYWIHVAWNRGWLQTCEYNNEPLESMKSSYLLE
jgi:hypothetical protein